MNSNLENLSVEELNKLIREAQNVVKEKQSGDFLRRLLQSNDFMTNLLKSEPFLNFCKSEGFDLNAEDIVATALPEYLKLFAGGK